jgi:endonuclease IV
MQFGLKLGSKNINYTKDIHVFFQAEYFKYIELFAIPDSFNDTIVYWKQFSIPIIIHAPHSDAGLNLSLKNERENNTGKLNETFKFADSLKSEYIIFHSGVDGEIDETVNQLYPFMDRRCLIENKPLKGLQNGKCIGATVNEIQYLLNELKAGFCLDFGHAICAANSLKIEPFKLIKDFIAFNPLMYHLTDGDYASEYDSHLHYGKGSFPLKELLKMVPHDTKLTNEAKHDSNTDLNDFEKDVLYFGEYIK